MAKEPYRYRVLARRYADWENSVLPENRPGRGEWEIELAEILGGEVPFGPSGLMLYQTDLDYLAKLHERWEKKKRRKIRK